MIAAEIGKKVELICFEGRLTKSTYGFSEEYEKKREIKDDSRVLDLTH